MEQSEKKELENILQSKELSAKEEADLLAHCCEERMTFARAAPVDKIREESMLAGLGVIAPNEIGVYNQSR